MILAYSAAEAVEEARWMFRGQKIRACYKGVKPEDVAIIRAADKDAKPLVGWIDHDVPPHEAIPLDAVRPKRIRHTPPITPSMFNEDEIEAECQKAKEKFNQI